MNKLSSPSKERGYKAPEHELAPKSAEGPFWELKDVPGTKDLALNQETFEKQEILGCIAKNWSQLSQPSPFILSSP